MKTMILRASLSAVLALASLGSPAAFGADAHSGYGVTRVAASTPTPRQIEDAIRAKNWTGAESMLDEVLRDKPDSAKAWYWMAQTQEKLNHQSKALQALGKAENLDPSLKFASPGAVADMRSRLGQSTMAQSRPTAPRPQSAPQAIPGYESRSRVGDSGAAVANRAQAPVQSSSHVWMYVLGFLLLAGGGAWYFIHKRNQKQEQEAGDAQERDRKTLLGRANNAQERATSLFKTARFETQESSAFGVAAAGVLSRANSALSRLKGSNATFDAYHERSALDTMESELESLENQAARKAWDEQPVAPTPAAAPAADPSYNQGGMLSSGQPQGYNPGYAPAGYAPMQQGPSTVVVNQGSGSSLLETMVIANALGHNHHDREYDLERDNQRLRDQQRHDAQPQRYEPAPVQESSTFDLGGNDSSWDNSSSGGNDSGSVDTGSSDSGSDDNKW
jgi:tetratricopeptide (TPR) repeat protein